MTADIAKLKALKTDLREQAAIEQLNMRAQDQTNRNAMTDDEIVEAMARAIAPLAWQASADNLAQENRRKASLKHARAALSVARPMIEAQRWRPIESAPKDETLILACNAKFAQVMAIVYWSTDREIGGSETHPWCGDDSTMGYHRDFFTHWMPPPAPPATEENENV